ncbi:MAG: reprolysin-like metallopeptidase [Phycisphaerales bacterium]
MLFKTATTIVAVLTSIALGQPRQADFFTALPAMPQSQVSKEAWVRPDRFGSWRISDLAKLKALLATAPMEFTPEGDANPVEFPIPRPDGTFAWFAIVEAPVMQAGLAATFPDMKTYRGQGLDDPAANVRLDFTPNGFRASVLSPNGSYYIDPFSRGDIEYYVSYFINDLRPSAPFVCHTPDPTEPHDHDHDHDAGYGDRVSGSTLRTFTLAVAATGEFTSYYGGSQTNAQAAIVSGVNRINQIWENECAIRFELVNNNQNIVYTNSSTDPYTGTDLNAMLGENQTNINAVIGSANYDIGHVVTGVNLGGLAQLAVVCGSSKARAGTGLSAPTGDYFWISYMSHELGHQFSATHTFNSNTSPCSTNRSAATAYEPGGGTTIMSYAGVCAADNIQGQSNPYFHTASHDQIMNHANSRTCDTETATGNSVPTANAGIDRAIPIGTLFTVTGTASDANGDALTYCWEQLDAGAAQTLAEMQATDNGSSPIFRSFPASTTGITRTFPRYSDVLYNTVPAGERYPGATRTMDLRFTVRDNRSGGGGVISDTMVINVRAESGPFVLTFPSAPSLNWTSGTQQTITWDVANTTAAPVSAANVNILLSTDGGYTFPVVLAANTPNDGSQVITVPEVLSAACRIRIEPTNNIFFDISNYNFEISCDTAPLPNSVQATDSTLCDRVNITWNAAAGATGYEILRNTINLGSTATLIGSSSTTNYSDLTAVPGTTYFYFVRSLNSCGASGVSISNAGTRGVGAAAPTSVSASDSTSCATVFVSWSASSGATGYQVWRNSTNSSAGATQIGTVTNTTFSDSTLGSGASAFYFVVATSSCGSSAFSASDSGSTQSVPVAPAGVSAADGTSGPSISWNSVAGASSYDVLRSSTNSLAGATSIANLAGTSYTDAGAATCTTFYYWVRANNSCGSSGASGGSSARKLLNPVAPTSLAANRNGFCSTDSGQITLSATGGSGDTLRWYSGACEGVTLGTGASITIDSPAVSTTYFARYENACGNSACASVAVNVLSAPAITSVSLSGGPNYSIGQSVTLSVTLDSAAPSGGSLVSISSAMFPTTTINVASGQNIGTSTVTFNNFGVNQQAIASANGCVTGAATSSAFSVFAGSTLYISASTGSDSNSGTSAGSALATFDAAMNRIAPGGTIIMSAGDYSPVTNASERSVNVINDGSGEVKFVAPAGQRLFSRSTPSTTTFTGIRFTNASVTGDGAAFHISNGAVVNLIACEISSCSASANGGAINVSGAGSKITMLNCTLSGNSAGSGGGAVYLGVGSTLESTHSTIAFNQASQGGGISISAGANASLAATLVSDNTATVGPQAFGAVQSLGFNLFSNGSGVTGLGFQEISAIGMEFAPLAPNGGSTHSHAIGSTSPAIDAAGTACATSTDQRGTSRPIDGNNDGTAACDVGSFEASPALCPWQTAGCAADFDNSGGVDGDDVIAFFAEWDGGANCADVDLSASTDGDDVILFFSVWDEGGC